MKAALVKSYGGPEVVEISQDFPDPTQKENQVLVEVMSTSINPFDVAVRNGYLKDRMSLELPYIPGGDFAGVVKNPGSSGIFKEGDRVYGQAVVFNGGSGTFAEICAANNENIALMPKEIGFPEAGVLPLVGTSVVQAIIEHMSLSPGQKILIHGGAGGIGHIAIQLAKSLGAYVVTTVRFDDFDFVRALGADEIIDYKNEMFDELQRGLDAVFDTVGGPVTTRSLKVLKRGGTIVSMKGAPDQNLAQDFNVRAVGQATITSTARLNILTKFVESGKIKIHTAKVFPLQNVTEAFTYFEKEHFSGKVGITVKE